MASATLTAFASGAPCCPPSTSTRRRSPPAWNTVIGWPPCDLPTSVGPGATGADAATPSPARAASSASASAPDPSRRRRLIGWERRSKHMEIPDGPSDGREGGALTPRGCAVERQAVASGGPARLARILRDSVPPGLVGERYLGGDAGLAAGHAGDVAPAGQVLRQHHVARPEPVHRAIPQL